MCHEENVLAPPYTIVFALDWYLGAVAFIVHFCRSTSDSSCNYFDYTGNRTFIGDFKQFSSLIPLL